MPPRRSGLTFAAPAHAAADHVRYEIESNRADLAGHLLRRHRRHQAGHAAWLAAYWREFTNVATYPFYSVSAHTEGTTVTCRLFVNGDLVDSNTTYGRYTIADCSYSP